MRHTLFSRSRTSSTGGKPGRVRRRDHEYVRKGTANVFCIVEPKAGCHLIHATANRKKPVFVAALRRTARMYPDAHVIHVVLDNLNTLRLETIVDVLGPHVRAAHARGSSSTSRRSTPAG